MASRRAAVANGRAVVSSVRLDKKAVMMLINGFVSVANSRVGNGFACKQEV